MDRPIQHLYPLEMVSPLHAAELDDQDNAANHESISEQQVVIPPRSRRIAFAQARDRILAQSLAGYEE